MSIVLLVVSDLYITLNGFFKIFMLSGILSGIEIRRDRCASVVVSFDPLIPSPYAYLTPYTLLQQTFVALVSLCDSNSTFLYIDSTHLFYCWTKTRIEVEAKLPMAEWNI